MKCDFCQDNIDDTNVFCPNCGNKIKKKKNNKSLIIVSVWIITIILLITMAFVIMFTSFNNYKIHESNQENFVQEVNKLGCEVINVLETTPNENTEFYLITDRATCPYLIAYTEIIEDNTRNKLYYELFKEVNKVDSTYRTTTTVNVANYNEQVTIGTYYKSVSSGNNHILYIETDKNNKDIANDLKKSLGFYFEMNWAFLYVFVAAAILIFLLIIVSWWKLNKKMGRPGWIVLIPIYNLICLCEDIMGKKIYTLLFFIPFVNYIFILVLNFNIAKVFGKNDGYQVLSVFFPLVVIPIIAFDDSTYTEPNKLHDTKENINNTINYEEKTLTVDSRIMDFNNYQLQENKSVWTIILTIIKWILSLFMLLISSTIFDSDNTISDIIICIYFFIFSLMMCPLITKYTTKYKTYTKNKGWIALIIIVSMIFIVGFFE